VDPQTVLLLRAEMTSRVRRRRLRSLAIARTLDLVGPLEGSILHLLEDEDHLVRAEAAAALSKSRSPASHDALCEALGDRSPTVREAARKSLDQWARSAPAMPLVPLAVLPEEIEELRR
jgi:HEAT repeat protein